MGIETGVGPRERSKGSPADPTARISSPSTAFSTTSSDPRNFCLLDTSGFTSPSQSPPPYFRRTRVDAGKSGPNNGFVGYRVGRVQPPAHPDLHHYDIQLQPLNVFIAVLIKMSDLEVWVPGSSLSLSISPRTRSSASAATGLLLKATESRTNMRCGLLDRLTGSGGDNAWRIEGSGTEMLLLLLVPSGDMLAACGSGCERRKHIRFGLMCARGRIT